MEFSNSDRGEIIYQKDTHSSLGEVALKLLTNYHEDTRSELPGKALADLKEEYDDVAGKHKEFAEHLNEASSLSSLVAAAGHLISLKDVMYEINNGVQLSLSSDANGEVPGDSTLPENIPCDLAKVKISENDDGTYTAKIPVTEHRFDCNRHISMVQVTRKDQKEANENIIRRFNRRVLQSGVLARAKSVMRFEKPISKTERRKKAIIRRERRAEKTAKMRLGVR